jgi:zinc transporter
VVAEQLADRRAEAMTRQSFVLTVVAAIFLPLGLITGLLGINVGGMPGAESGAAFWIVTGLLVALGAGLWLLFRRRRWL